MLFDFAWLYVTVVELLHALKAMPQLRSLKCTRIQTNTIRSLRICKSNSRT